MKIADLRDYEFRIIDVTNKRLLLEDADGSVFEINAVPAFDGEPQLEFYELKAKQIGNG